MLDFGFSEILLTSAIALVVLGPERLPKVARQVGNWMGRARVMARQLSEQLEREVSAEELLKLQMKSPLKPDQPALVAPASAPTFPMPQQSQMAAAVSEDGTVGAEAATPPPPRPLPDGHATTVAAMHPPMPGSAAPAAPAADHPPTANQ
ncbi:MAG: Sec-independent protein translocase protein TatB [Steroidobacteraceae bacterium]|jgi:sec-independent protein translocase protein TatB